MTNDLERWVDEVALERSLKSLNGALAPFVAVAPAEGQ
jgi:hypothetical protein